jgi:hypothetical protein
MHNTLSDVNKSRRQLFLNFVIADRTHGDCLAGDKVRQAVRSWLSPPETRKNFNVARKSRHGETGTWFVEGDTFSEWKWSGPISLLWIHGKCSLSPALTLFIETDGFPFVAGAGKSVLWYVELLIFSS